jgi:AraC-like DNA-binding protein
MLSQLMKKESLQRLDILSALLVLLNQLSCMHEQRGENAPAAEGTLLFQVIRHINEHLAEPITLDSLCEQFYLSKPQLCRSFKRTTGASVGEYINAKRLLQAQTMLRAGTPPTQVCTACGFNDYSAFYRAYRKHFGIGPKKTQQADK